MSNTVPILAQEGAWQIWNYNQVYQGPTGAGRFVPNVGDEVHQFINNSKTEYLVTAVDPTTYMPTMVVLEDNANEGEFPENTLFGAGPGPESSTFCVYIDNSVTPSTMAVDKRCWCGGALTSYAKIFQGTDISSTGTVISAVYDSSGNFVSENVSLELAGTFQGQAMVTNTSIWLPNTCSTHATLPDGAVVTIVFYDTAGVAVSWRQLQVRNTAFVRRLNAAVKEVISIGLQTPFLAAANSTQINYPVNVPLTALNLIGVVNYNDGTSASWAVDGTHFAVAGLEGYAPTIVGQEVPIVLKYPLQQNEEAQAASNGVVSQIYTIVTQAASGNYAVQLYAYPVWISSQVGYTLEWMLYDLDRSINYVVTPYVNIDTTQTVFSPTNYGAKQTLNVFIDLADVNAIYNQFYHTQIVDVVLNNPATTRPAINALPNWQVTQTSGTTPLFGQGVYAKFYAPSSNSAQITLGGDFTDQASWLNAYFTLTRPLFNPATESAPPLPTHFTINGVAYPLSQWNSQINLANALTNNGTLLVGFIQRTSQTDLQLTVAGVPLRQIDSNGNYL